MPAPLALAIRRQIADRLRAGESVAAVARAAGVSEPTVRRIARAEGIVLALGRPVGRSVSGAQVRQDARQLADLGLSQGEIAAQLGRSERSVLSYLSDGE